MMPQGDLMAGVGSPGKGRTKKGMTMTMTTMTTDSGTKYIQTRTGMMTKVVFGDRYCRPESRITMRTGDLRTVVIVSACPYGLYSKEEWRIVIIGGLDLAPQVAEFVGRAIMGAR